MHLVVCLLKAWTAAYVGVLRCSPGIAKVTWHPARLLYLRQAADADVQVEAPRVDKCTGGNSRELWQYAVNTTCPVVEHAHTGYKDGFHKRHGITLLQYT